MSEQPKWSSGSLKSSKIEILDLIVFGIAIAVIILAAPLSITAVESMSTSSLSTTTTIGAATVIANATTLGNHSSY
jgi:hypothetical protein